MRKNIANLTFTYIYRQSDKTILVFHVIADVHAADVRVETRLVFGRKKDDTFISVKSRESSF